MQATPRNRVVVWLGSALVLAGLGLLGYVGWHVFGTNIVSEQRQRETVEKLERQWQEERLGVRPDGKGGGAGVGSGGDGSDAAAGAGAGGGDVLGTGGVGVSTRSVQAGDAMALIRIPRFGEDYVMPVMEGVGDDVLARGYGHFEESAAMGEKGNFAVAAHRVTHGEPLRDMPSLRPGDEVIVETRDTIYTYELDTDPNALVVTFRDVWVVAPEPENPDPNGVQPADAERLITLTTCAELFHTDDRMIAFGHLVDTDEK
jgi:sortase A